MDYALRAKGFLPGFLTGLLFAIVFLAPGCSPGEKASLGPAETKVLGHRGSGKTAVSGLQENTYTSVKQAFKHLDGVEIDIQCSRDGTLWLYHDAGLPHNPEELLCIPASTDAQLKALGHKDSAFTLTTLEEVFILMTLSQFRPVVSLDIKGYFPNGCFSQNNAPHEYFDRLLTSLEALLNKYGLHNRVMVETDYQYFLDQAKGRLEGVECYLLGYEDLNELSKKALKKSYHGISYNYANPELDSAAIAAVRAKGLKVQLWSLYDEEAMEKALSLGADYIQTGLVPQD